MKSKTENMTEKERYAYYQRDFTNIHCRKDTYNKLKTISEITGDKITKIHRDFVDALYDVVTGFKSASVHYTVAFLDGKIIINVVGDRTYVLGLKSTAEGEKE